MLEEAQAAMQEAVDRVEDVGVPDVVRDEYLTQLRAERIHEEVLSWTHMSCIRFVIHAVQVATLYLQLAEVALKRNAVDEAFKFAQRGMQVRPVVPEPGMVNEDEQASR